MRKVDLLVLHCSASDRKEDDSISKLELLHTGPADQEITWGTYEINCFDWDDVGYQYFILKSGEVIECRPEADPGAHCKGFNQCSIGICLSGNTLFTQAQKTAAARLILSLMIKYDLSLVDIVNHNELNPQKPCPNFNKNTIIKEIYKIKRPA